CFVVAGSAPPQIYISPFGGTGRGEIEKVGCNYRPDHAPMYRFDLGKKCLRPMEDGPHVADYVTVDKE
ncbi:hypothetical protein ACEE96_13130, partial [Staphylococcus simulans]